jgi:hypothetical protein
MIIKVESSNINEAIMSCFKALSSYWPGNTEKDDHGPFQNIEYVVEANAEQPANQPAHSTPVKYLSFFEIGIFTINL